MEKFKNIDEINQMDDRFNLFVKNYEKLKFDDLYNAINKINLNKNVHDDVISQFNIAKNLYIYSWYVYSFNSVAELKAISKLEFALRLKINPKNKKCGLSKLIKEGINKKLISEKIFSEHLIKYLIRMRNNLAHGSTTQNLPSTVILDKCAECINELFKNDI